MMPYREWRVFPRRSKFSSRGLPRSGGSVELDDEKIRFVEEYIMQFKSVWSPRSVFITNRSTMSLGPHWIKEGDTFM